MSPLEAELLWLSSLTPEQQEAVFAYFRARKAAKR